MSKKNIPNADRILRYVPWAKLRKTEDDQVIGVLPVAFQLREGEPYLSATWIEFFSSAPTPLHVAVQAVRNSNLDVRPKSGFAIGVVEAVKKTCEEYGHRVRILHEAEPDNPAHVAVRQYPQDDLELFGALADDSWSQWG